MRSQRPDPFARFPETTEFILVLPASIHDDVERREEILDRLEGAFPGSTFRAAECERLQSPEGQPLIVSDPLVIPLMGGAGENSDPGGYRRRPSEERMREIMAAMTAFIGGEKALN